MLRKRNASEKFDWSSLNRLLHVSRLYYICWLHHTRSHHCTHECSCRRFLLNFGFCLHFRKLLLILFSFYFVSIFRCPIGRTIKETNSKNYLYTYVRCISAATLWGASKIGVFLYFVIVFSFFLAVITCTKSRQLKLQQQRHNITPTTITTTDTCSKVALHCRHIQIETMLLYVILLCRERGSEREGESEHAKKTISGLIYQQPGDMVVYGRLICFYSVYIFFLLTCLLCFIYSPEFTFFPLLWIIFLLSFPFPIHSLSLSFIVHLMIVTPFLSLVYARSHFSVFLALILRAVPFMFLWLKSRDIVRTQIKNRTPAKAHAHTQICM